MPPSDQDTIQRCRDGRPDEFRFLVERYQGAVYAFLSSRLNDRTLALEAVEESFVRAFFALDRLQNPAAFHAWLLGIASRVGLEFQRTRFRRREVPPPTADFAAAAPDQPDDGHEDALAHAIAALPEPQRTLILMRYFENLSCQEIAARQQMPLGTVTKTLSRAYAGLRALMAAREN